MCADETSVLFCLVLLESEAGLNQLFELLRDLGMFPAVKVSNNSCHDPGGVLAAESRFAVDDLAGAVGRSHQFVLSNGRDGRLDDKGDVS